jgi:uncharacterized membrane protein
MHSEHELGSYDSAFITKDEQGKIHVAKHEAATRHGTWGGAATGAVIGLLFPPAIIASTIVGAAVGGLGGHFWRGMSRSDLKELGELIDNGEAALLVVGDARVEGAIQNSGLKPEKVVTKHLDLRPQDIDDAINAAAEEMSKTQGAAGNASQENPVEASIPKSS